MKISGRIDGSIRGAILSTRPSASAPATARVRGDRTCGLGYAAALAADRSRHDAKCPVPVVYARRRPRTVQVLPPPGSRSRSTFFRPSLPPAYDYQTTTVPGSRTPRNTLPPSRTKEELLSLVDQQDAGTVEEHLDFFRDPFLRGYAPADGPNIVVSSRADDINYPSANELIQANKEEEQILRDLRSLVIARLRNPARASVDSVYQIYQRLPEPRMGYLPARLRHQLLRTLAQPEKKDSGSMLRYFAAIADVKNSGLPLTKGEWNSAISFASRYVGTSTDVETESALNLWREMEQDAGIRGNDVTFNILFDVASKTGNFTLAEMIYKEMEDRGYAFNRYHYVSLIHFFGLKLDGNGVRAAYREMVNSGEIIDTVALNSVISGLLRSGEEEAAERVYDRMKEAAREAVMTAAAAATATGGRGSSSRAAATAAAAAEVLPPRNYAVNKMITKALMMFARVGRYHPPMRSRFQSVAPLTPDLQTYRVLINHYGARLGDLVKVAQYLDEMKLFHVPLHGAIFLALFKGFHAHGGFSGSAWSEQRLDSIWAAFLQALDEGAAGLRIETWLAMWALKAFRKCSSKEKVMQVYEALESRWELDHTSARFMMDFLHTTLNGDPLRS